MYIFKFQKLECRRHVTVLSAPRWQEYANVQRESTEVKCQKYLKSKVHSSSVSELLCTRVTRQEVTRVWLHDVMDVCIVVRLD
jgi:hypothetical protein